MNTRQTKSKGWKRIAIGIVIELLSLFSFLCMVGAFGSVGAAVSGFLIGFFGLANYAYSLVGMIAGVLVIANKKPTAPVTKICVLVFMLLTGILALHVYSSNQHIVNTNYGGYLLNCYNFTNTAGGMLLGIIAYPLMKLLSNVGALILCCIIFFTLVFVALIPSFRRNQTYEVTSKVARERGPKKTKKQKNLEKRAYIHEEQTPSSRYEENEQVEKEPEFKPNPIEGGDTGMYTLRGMARNILFTENNTEDNLDRYHTLRNPEEALQDISAPYSNQKSMELEQKLGYTGHELDIRDVFDPTQKVEISKPQSLEDEYKETHPEGLKDFEALKQEQIQRYREMYSGVEPVYEADSYTEPQGDKIYKAEETKNVLMGPDRKLDLGSSVRPTQDNNRFVTTGMQGVVNRAINKNNVLELRPEELQANAYGKEPQVIDEVRIPKAFEESSIENKKVDLSGGYYNDLGKYITPNKAEEEKVEEKVEVREDNVDTRTVTPFINDENRPQVQGFDDTPYQPMPWQVMVPVKKKVVKKVVKTTPVQPKPEEVKVVETPKEEVKVEPEVKIVEKPVYIEKIVEKPVYIEKPLEKPVDTIEPETQKVEEKPVDKVDDNKPQTLNEILESHHELKEKEIEEPKEVVLDEPVESTIEEPVDTKEQVVEKVVEKKPEEKVQEVEKVEETKPEEKEKVETKVENTKPLDKKEEIITQYNDPELKAKIKSAGHDAPKESEVEKQARLKEEAENDKKQRKEIIQTEKKVKKLEEIDTTKERVSQVTVEQAIEQVTPKRPYVAPPLSLLRDPEPPLVEDDDFETKSQIIVNTLEMFNIKGEVLKREVGPTFSLYTLHVEMPRGKTIGSLVNLENDIAMQLAEESVRILAPIPGKNAVGIEIPNKTRRIVRLSELLSSDSFKNAKSPATFGLGKDLYGKDFLCDIKELPHMLIAGATGAGKSCCINSIIVSLLYKASPDDVRLILVDPKRVELSMYEGIPHLLLDEIVCDVDKAIRALNWAIDEMNRRIEFLSERKFRNIDEYNDDAIKNGYDKIPRIVVIVDELADLIDLGKKSVENAINRIARLARAVGIHLILATQRPSVDVVSGTIKNNLPSRVAFKVTSGYDSKTILDVQGAEKLLGYGDLLYMTPKSASLDRMQGAFISNEEVQNVVDFIKTNNDSFFDQSIKKAIFSEEQEEEEKPKEKKQDKGLPPELFSALELGMDGETRMSISFLQRKLGLGWPKAGKIYDMIESLGYLQPDPTNPKIKVVKITQEEFDELVQQNEEDTEE